MSTGTWKDRVGLAVLSLVIAGAMLSAIVALAMEVYEHLR